MKEHDVPAGQTFTFVPPRKQKPQTRGSFLNFMLLGIWIAFGCALLFSAKTPLGAAVMAGVFLMLATVIALLQRNAVYAVEIDANGVRVQTRQHECRRPWSDIRYLYFPKVVNTGPQSQGVLFIWSKGKPYYYPIHLTWSNGHLISELHQTLKSLRPHIPTRLFL